MQKNLIRVVVSLAAAMFAAGCSHSEPKPTPAPVQQPAPAPAPAPATAPAPSTAPAPAPAAACGAFGSGQLPKGAHITDSQAGAAAAASAARMGLPGACPVAANFKNGAWEVVLHGPGSGNQVSKMRMVVGNDSAIHSHALVAPGAPDWNTTP